MQKRSYSFFIVLMICVTIPSLSQGVFLSRGEKAFQLGTGFFLNSESGGFLLKGGYSYDGSLDAELLWQKGKEGTQYRNLIIPRITYYPLKEEDTPTAPTVGIAVQYTQYARTERTTVTVPIDFPTVGYAQYDLLKDVTYRYVIASASIYRSLGIWQRYTIKPFAECGFGASEREWKFLWKIGVSAAKQVQQRSLFILTPSIQREPNITTISITLGFIIQ